MPDARYDGVNKEWLFRKDHKDRIVDLIAEDCISKGVCIADVPDFAYEIAKNTVPFSGHNKKCKVLNLNYESEIK